MTNATLDHEDRIKEQVEHAKIHLDRPVKFWKNVLLRDVTKLNVFGLIDQQYVWCKQGKAYEQTNTIPMKKHGGGPVLLRECFAVAESEYFDCMKDIIGFSEESGQESRCL